MPGSDTRREREESLLPAESARHVSTAALRWGSRSATRPRSLRRPPRRRSAAPSASSPHAARRKEAPFILGRSLARVGADWLA